MIKKLLLMGVVAVMATSINAQDATSIGTTGPLVKTPVKTGNVATQAKIASATVVDTLWYFYNKHFYRNPANTGYYTFKNANTYTSTTAITQGGALFKNSGVMVVSGAEGVAARLASSPSTSVNIGLFLYNVTGGVPVGVPIASLTAMVTGTAGSFFGGDFAAPAIVTGDYAIMMKNVSSNPADTIKMFINNALQASSTSTNNAAKYGEGFGLIGYGLNSFTTTTGIFGAGTDFEFLVAPRVGYSVTATASAPSGSCTATAYTFTNTSSPWIGNRQYNLNQFAVQWAPFANTSASITAAPVYVWNFGDGSSATNTNGTVTTVNHTFNAAGTYTGTLTGNIQKMSDYFGTTVTDVATWTKTYAVCVGIKTISGFESFNVYPNPAVNGKTNITGLNGTSTIVVYNMLGQVVSSQSTDKDVVTIDLSNQMTGNYVIRITNAENQTKTIKVINN